MTTRFAIPWPPPPADRRTSAEPPRPMPDLDPLFGPGLRLAHEQAEPEKGGTTLQTLRRLPALLGLTVRLGWQADRRALVTVMAGQLLIGVATAVNLLATQR